MRNTQKLERARRELGCAERRAFYASHRRHLTGRKAETHLLAADLCCREGGREDLGYRLADALDGDVTSAETRAEMRAVMDALDAEVDPDSVGFRPASDGGVER